MPIPQSPSHLPLYSSALNTNTNAGIFSSRPNRSAYGRPVVRSRSRQASPALSIGSTSGVLSTSLGNNGGGRPSVSLGQAFIPTGQGSGLVQTGTAQGLGGLGLLSLSNSQSVKEDGEESLGEDGESRNGGEEREEGSRMGMRGQVMDED